MTRAEESLDETFVGPPSPQAAYPELLGHAAATGQITPLYEPEAAVFEQGSGEVTTGSAGEVEAVTPTEPPEAHAQALSPQELNRVLIELSQDPDVSRLIREARQRKGNGYRSTHTAKGKVSHPRDYGSEAPLPHQRGISP